MIPGYKNWEFLDDGRDWSSAVPPPSGRAFPLQNPLPPPLTEDQKALRELQEMNKRSTFILSYPLPEDHPSMRQRAPKPTPKQARVIVPPPPPPPPPQPALADVLRSPAEAREEERRRRTSRRAQLVAVVPPVGPRPRPVVAASPPPTQPQWELADFSFEALSRLDPAPTPVAVVAPPRPRPIDSTPPVVVPPPPTVPVARAAPGVGAIVFGAGAGGTLYPGAISAPTVVADPTTAFATPPRVGHVPTPAPRGPGPWQLTDYSYESLLALGEGMAVCTGLKKKQLDRYGPRPYDGDANVACAICIDDMRAGEPSLTVRCGHCFHHKCIIQWLLRSNRCPTCRFEIPRME